jgi:hypothetical protein
MSVSSYDCPQCGAPVKFQSSIAVFAVCEHCRSMVVRKDLNLETIGVMAELPPDLSPLQIGTRGEWKGRSFELLGRIRVEWGQGSWNEWYASFSDGGVAGWVAEAQGFYMVSFETKDKNLPAAPEDVHAGDFLKFAGGVWSISDIKTVRCCAGEGELPFPAPPGLERKSIDLTGSDGAFGSLEFSDGQTLLYTGAYAKFGDLHFSNLRPVPGWSAEAAEITNQTNALNCPKCGAVVNLRAVGQTMAAVCGSCGSLIDTSNPVWKLIQDRDEKVGSLHPVLPIGARGKLGGVDYEVIGFLQRADSESTWSEFLLFNPWHGFEWLVTSNGHWSFVHRCPEIADLSGPKIKYAGRHFILYARDKATVTAVLGEFYWKVRVGEKAVLTDYIDPPAVLSKEVYPDLQEFTWSMGEYIDPAVVGTAFNVKDLPKPSGLYLNQPNPYIERWKGVRVIALLAVIAFTAIQIMTASHAKRKVDYDVDLAYRWDDGGKVVVSPKFKIEGSQQLVEIEADAKVDNNWMEFDMELVDANTRQVYPATVEIEYYHGYDEDGSWSEGSGSNSVAIPAVPPGEYYLTIEASSDPLTTSMLYHVALSSGGVFWSNYFFGLLLILAYPIYLLLRRNGFENLRWAESDFSRTGLTVKHHN